MTDDKKLWRVPKKRWLLGIPAGGFLMFALGAIALGMFNTTMDVTSKDEFCLGCHEMSAFTYPEYEESGHFSNSIGVRAHCADCHLPHDGWFKKTARKIYVSKDLIYHMTGKIDTREKYEEHRLDMAQREWLRMEKNDSAECRSCHSFNAMNLDDQERRARRKHTSAMESGETCIECHKGVAHALPEDMPEGD